MRFTYIALLPLLLSMTPVAQAQSAQDVARATIQAAAPMFTEQDRREIDDWIRLGKRVLTGDDSKHGGKDKKMPPGLAKRDQLPPGLAKRDTLPPGLAKRDLPSDLERRLSRLPGGYSRKTVGSDIVLIEEATGIVLDILKGAARR
ncbi:hypothetical protein [Magnetospirillum sp. 64-120]|mgnify:CR=1 FL=1|uniref:hypothetical protein n=1 Tax=Magnetospirillum sp. 64-120 TaxID=1895778 RepID=UPI0025C401CF|nr:hypothetical protein [Magnetospirillum sp. 64-120]